MSDDIKFNCGSYEQNRNMAEHINRMCNHGNPSGTSCWDGKVYIDMDSLSHETSETQRSILDIASNYEE